MSMHNICFYGKIRIKSQNYHQIFLLNKFSVYIMYITFKLNSISIFVDRPYHDVPLVLKLNA